MPNLQLLQYLALSLFCGWGGGDRGLHDAGFFTPWAVDWDRHAIECYKLNFPQSRIERFNLFKVPIEHIMQVFGISPLQADTMLLACPCQGISLAGKGDPYDKRNTLFLRSLLHFIPKVLPKTFIFENVSSLTNKNMILFYNLLQYQFERLSKEYIIEQRIMNTLHYGVGQSRERYIAVGVHRSLGIEPSFPEPDLSDEGKRICDLVPDLDGIRYGYGTKAQQWQDMKFKDRTGFCNTITKTPNIWGQRNGEIVDLTIEELLKFCAYPPDWKYTGSYIQVWNRIGNSIMPPFMKAIGEHIRGHILEKAGVPKQSVEPLLYQSETNQNIILP
jgi:DNA (cytosine-5)-methyltransferase 1